MMISQKFDRLLATNLLVKTEIYTEVNLCTALKPDFLWFRLGFGVTKLN